MALDLPLDLRHLTSVLEEELDQALNPTAQQPPLSHRSPGVSGPNSGSFHPEGNNSTITEEDADSDKALAAKVGAYACRNEVRYLRSVTVPNLILERDKLRSDLTESNQRTVDLATEIDEQNAKTERAANERLR